MTAIELLQIAQREFGDARILTTLTEAFTPAAETVLEVRNPIDRNWRQAARVTRSHKGAEVLISPPPRPSDPSDWRRTEKIAADLLNLTRITA